MLKQMYDKNKFYAVSYFYKKLLTFKRGLRLIKSETKRMQGNLNCNILIKT